MLFGVIAINALLIRKLEERQVFFNMLKWVGIFGLLYLLLLPLGGYRDYRPLIVRRDTFMPVLFGLIVVYGYSTSLLLRSLRGKSFWFFGGMIMGVISIFTLADISGLDKNKCEKECLEILAGSNENITRLPADCTVMNWTIRRDPQKSVNIAEMIHYWNITNSVRLYYQE